MKGKRRLLSAIYMLSFVFAAISTCQASLIFGNLPGSDTYSGTGQLLSSTDEIAIGVLTGSSTMQFNFLQGYFTGGAGNTLGGGIFSNSAGSPGTEIGVFGSQPINTGTPTLVTFATTSSVVLQANTEYWFVVDPPAPVKWLADSSNGGDGTVPAAENGSGYTSEGYVLTINSGSGWSSDNTVNPTVQIDASAIPEPGSLTMLACGCAVLFGRRLVRRCAAR